MYVHVCVRVYAACIYARACRHTHTYTHIHTHAAYTCIYARACRRGLDLERLALRAGMRIAKAGYGAEGTAHAGHESDTCGEVLATVGEAERACVHVHVYMCMWHVAWDMWHVACGMGHGACDMCMHACDMCMHACMYVCVCVCVHMSCVPEQLKEIQPTQSTNVP